MLRAGPALEADRRLPSGEHEKPPFCRRRRPVPSSPLRGTRRAWGGHRGSKVLTAASHPAWRLGPLSIHSESGEKPGGPQHLDPAPGMQCQWILVARHDGGRTGGQGQFQVAVVFAVSAVPHLFFRLDPKRRRTQQLQDFATPITGEHPRELRLRQNLGDFPIHGLRRGYGAFRLYDGYGVSGRSVGVQGGRDDRVRIYHVDAQARRSAL